jgi:hypothetical protein
MSEENERSTRVCGKHWDIGGWHLHCVHNKDHEGGHTYTYVPGPHTQCICHCHRIGERAFACCGCTCTEEVLLEDVAKGRIDKELAAKIIEAGVEKGPGRMGMFGVL